MKTIQHNKRIYKLRKHKTYGDEYIEWEIYDVKDKKIIGYYSDGGRKIDIAQIKVDIDYLLK